MLHNPTGRERMGMAFLLSMFAILGPLNIDMYLPSFPDIANDFRANETLVQLSLTAALLGLAVGQLFVGPISDAKGRRGPLLFFTSIFAIASLLCAFAPNITTLIAARFLQGFTASAGIVLSRAVVRDVFSGRELTKFFALLMVINAFAPMVAPMAGGAILLIPSAEWPAIFITLAVLGVLMVVTATVKLPETLPVERRSPSSVKHTLRTMGSLFRDQSFIGYALIVGFVHGGSFAYVSGTPFVYQDIYGVSPQLFSILFGINGLAIVTGSFLIGRLSDRIHERVLLRTAIIIASIATCLLLVMATIQAPLTSLVILIFIYMICMGMVLTSSFTLAMAQQSHRAGSASAVLGMLPLAIGAIVSLLAGINEESAVPMALILFTSASIGVMIYFKLVRGKVNHQAAA
ncbi:Bcr/CflA family efflux MFS transporter [Aureibacillus halotolerans]|uniref:Bcr/CflA family efflux transporter n=1 Tax=Aureibacillus halotolerans TaxID=1508390 RepID=A0A4R6U5Z9_9BACI|nr:Bcr/CflA family efflux MFS transporter [Aureibacillus halotolerans]TDQ41186.1 DHA1 family bicyclomycin/chloramphenicol resistance-like MFS transporter [Aureibacillus halotolerans]